MKKKLSILIYSLDNGGAERVVSILLNGLIDKYNITLVLMNNIINYELPQNIEIHYLEQSEPSENGLMKFLKLPFLGFKYKLFCKKKNIDISLSFMNRPNYINILSKIFGTKTKILISERIAPTMEYQTNSLKDFISRKLISNLYNKANLIIPNAHGITLDLIQLGIKESLIKVINNPVDVDKIQKLKNEKVTIDYDKFTFITVGRLHPQKNHKLLLECIKIFDANLVIIGDGALQNDLKESIKKDKLEKKVFLLGKKSNPFSYISKANIFILGSNYEGFPNVLLEALACGIPIISTDCKSGPREILSPNSDVNFQLKDNIELAEYGILTPVQNIEKFQEAMKLLINDKALRENYQKKAKKRSNDFDVSKIIKEYEEVLCAV